MLTRRGATGDSRRTRRWVRSLLQGTAAAAETRSTTGGTALAPPALMSIVTKTSTLPIEPHDAPRATPPTPPEVAVREPAGVTSDPLDDLLENPYDNIACTD